MRGNPTTVLKDPSSVVLTETTAKKYFGSVDNAMGKVVEMDKYFHLKVTGIAKDVPSNSHLNFDLVVPLSNYFNYDFFNVWINNNLFTYVLLDEHADKAKLENVFPNSWISIWGRIWKNRRTFYSFTCSIERYLFWSRLIVRSYKTWR